MLDPQDRNLLLEALRPPPGYALDHAVGTTFSLDLIALLTAPLAFTLFALEDEEGKPSADPLALLAAVRSHADRITVFCQAGQIVVPPHDQLLYGYLEDSVFEVRAPREGGVFHPKVWLLRYSAPGDPVVYRLLCLSRNLTFDRSWDTMLVLDGELTRRRNAYKDNHPLGDFIRALPEMAQQPLPDRVASAIDRMQYEVRRVRFELPDAFESVAFWPLGLDGKASWPFAGRIDRLLVMSPFITAGALERLIDEGQDHVLVSRPDCLDELGAQAVAGFASTKVLSNSADVETMGEPGAREEDLGMPLTGLHAKVYVANAGWKASVWVGSANATDAAFNRNVEFLVKLTGLKSRCGIEAMLSPSQSTVCLGDLLQDYVPPAREQGIDEVMRRLERQADDLRRAISAAGLVAEARATDEQGTYDLLLKASPAGAFELPSDVELSAWPVTQREQVAATTVDPATEVVAEFRRVALASLTRFFAFSLVLTEAGRKHTARFVLNLPLEGTPENRHQAMLRSLLRNRRDVLRYLLFLLSQGDMDGVGGLVAVRSKSDDGASPDAGAFFGAAALFESLVRTLDRDPARLDQIARVVADLRQAGGEEALLPPEFDRIWAPIWAARKRLGK